MSNILTALDMDQTLFIRASNISIKKIHLNCKVEFIQLYVGFILCQNLLIIQHLETLYLSGNNVRVLCERV